MDVSLISRSGGDRFTFNDFASERDALTAARAVAQGSISAARAGCALADRFPDIGFTNCITNANDHLDLHSCESLSTVVATEYQ